MNKDDIPDSLIKLIIIALGALAWLWMGYALYSAFSSKTPVEPKESDKTNEIILVGGNCIKASSPPTLITAKIVWAEISAYNNLPNQTWGDPNIMASNRRVYEGAIANNCLPFGTMVEIDGEIYIVEDRMNSRYSCQNFDIFLFSYYEAKNFGRQKKQVVIYN